MTLDIELLKYLYLTVDQMTVRNVKGVAGSDKLKENYYQLCSSQLYQGSKVSFSLLFWFSSPDTSPTHITREEIAFE